MSLSTDRNADCRSALESTAPLARTLRLCPLPGASVGLSPTSSTGRAGNGEGWLGADSCAVGLGAVSLAFAAAAASAARCFVVRLRGVELGGAASASSAVAGAFSRSYGSLWAEALPARVGEGFAGLDSRAGGGACGCANPGAAVPSEFSRLLLADVFGLVRLSARGAVTGSGDVATGGSEGSRSGSGAGAAGNVKRSPKSASWTWWRLHMVASVPRR